MSSPRHTSHIPWHSPFSLLYHVIIFNTHDIPIKIDLSDFLYKWFYACDKFSAELAGQSCGRAVTCAGYRHLQESFLLSSNLYASLLEVDLEPLAYIESSYFTFKPQIRTRADGGCAEKQKPLFYRIGSGLRPASRFSVVKYVCVCVRAPEFISRIRIGAVAHAYICSRPVGSLQARVCLQHVRDVTPSIILFKLETVRGDTHCV